MRSPKQVVLEWLDAFNRRDANAAAELYHEDAINIQVADGDPVIGRESLRGYFAEFFIAFPDSQTFPLQVLEDGEWAVVEWKGSASWQGPFAGHAPNGKTFVLSGCGFFRVLDGKIKFQRGYWDKLTWFRQLGLPLDE